MACSAFSERASNQQCYESGDERGEQEENRLVFNLYSAVITHFYSYRTCSICYRNLLRFFPMGRHRGEPHGIQRA